MPNEEHTPNSFIAILKHANASRWCVEAGCTTCGAREFRNAVSDLASDLGGPLANALADLEIDELMTCRHWADAIEIALRDLPLGTIQINGVLSAWLASAEGHPRMLDHVLFRIVRYLPSTNSIRTDWVKASERLALKERDFSLIESLMLVLGQDASPELRSVAQEIAEKSPQMRRVIRNVLAFP